MSSYDRKLRELALIGGIPGMVCQFQTVKKGRFKNRLDRLLAVTVEALNKMSRPSLLDLANADADFDRFLQATGWKTDGRHVVTLISFAADMLDRTDSDMPAELGEILADLLDYFTRVKKDPPPCYWAGARAAEKWEQVVTEVHHDAA